jgi:hypothetical protein
MLDIQHFYSLLSNSTYLSLLFDIITTHTEAPVVTGHKVLYVLVTEVGRQTENVDQKNHVHCVLGQAGNFVG